MSTINLLEKQYFIVNLETVNIADVIMKIKVKKKLSWRIQVI